MASPAQPNTSWWHTILLNKRSLVSALLLVIVIVTMSSNPFWRWMYPIDYQTDIQSASTVMQVDPLLVASVIRVESKFRSEDVSHAGAIGLMQLMPDTAQWIAAQINANTSMKITGSNLSDPTHNISLGSYYIRYLSTRFNGNEVAAIAAYNAGPKRVQVWLSTGVWNGKLATVNDIPVGETRHFVDRVFYNYHLYKRIYGRDAQWRQG